MLSREEHKAMLRRNGIEWLIEEVLRMQDYNVVKIQKRTEFDKKLLQKINELSAFIKGEIADC